jgi:hypothetical protein
MATPINWTGKQSFRIIGTGLHEDTLRIRSNYRKRENIYKLKLPTLCITYADMKFVNDIGGKQLNWPESEFYGQKYFDPPIEIIGQSEVERLTWIRGAHRVVIGPKETEIEWYSFLDLVIPRFRISLKKPTEAMLEVDNAIIDVKPQLIIDIIQYANGRSIGGVCVVKRHPDWKEPIQKKPQYRLWVRVVDFEKQSPIVEAKLAFFMWRGGEPSIGVINGKFKKVKEVWTDTTGSVILDHRPAGELEAVTLAMEGYRATAKVWRAQANEPVNLLITALKLKMTKYPIQIHGKHRKTYSAIYNLDPGDNLEWLAESFRYKGVTELSEMNHIPIQSLGGQIPLPGWYFLNARAGDTLDSIADELRLKRGWPRTTGRHHRPNPDILIEHEIVAIPSPEFASEREPI